METTISEDINGKDQINILCIVVLGNPFSWMNWIYDVQLHHIYIPTTSGSPRHNIVY